jgi:O-antigen ligase
VTTGFPDVRQARGFLLCCVAPLVLSFDSIAGSPAVLGARYATVARALHDFVLLGMGLVLAWNLAHGRGVLRGILGGVSWTYLLAAAVSLFGLVGTPLFEFAYLRVVLTGLVTWGLVVAVLAQELTAETWRVLLLLSLAARGMVFAIYRLYMVASIPGEPPRVTPFGHLNTSAGYVALCLPILAGLWLHAGRRLHRCLLLIAGATMVVALVTTGSRGALLALVVGSVAAACLGRGRRAAVAVIMVLALGLLLAPLSLSRRLGTVLNPSYATNVFRIELWRNVLDIVSRRPVFGVGYGSLWYFYRPYLDGGVEALPGGHAHNVLLHTLAETGVLGLAALGCVFCFSVLRAWRRWRAGRRWLALGVMSSLMVMWAHGMVDTVFREYHVQVLFWSCVALLCADEAVRRGDGASG